MQVRKKNDLMVPRVLFGARKSKKERKERKDKRGMEGPARFDVVDLVESTDNFDHRKFEVYYRLLLLCQYYFEYFNEQKKEADQSQDNEKVLLRLKPNNNAPEGSLLKMLFDIFEESKGTSAEGIKMNITQVKEYIANVDRLIDYHQLKGSGITRVYDCVVEYVNKNYGIINVYDYKNIKKIEKQRNDKLDSNDVKIQSILDQMSGIHNDNKSDFEGMLDFKQEVEDIEHNNSYLNVKRVQEFVQQQINKTNELFNTYTGDDESDKKKSLQEQENLYKLFRSLRYELKDKTREQKIIKLLEIINSPKKFTEFKNIAFNIHEELFFPLFMMCQLDSIASLVALSREQNDKLKQIAQLTDPSYILEHKNNVNQIYIASQINT
jgi:hypothetical protein